MVNFEQVNAGWMVNLPNFSENSHSTLSNTEIYPISWFGNFIARNFVETAFPQNFHTKKFGKILVFCAVFSSETRH